MVNREDAAVRGAAVDLRATELCGTDMVLRRFANAVGAIDFRGGAIDFRAPTIDLRPPIDLRGCAAVDVTPSLCLPIERRPAGLIPMPEMRRLNVLILSVGGLGFVLDLLLFVELVGRSAAGCKERRVVRVTLFFSISGVDGVVSEPDDTNCGG